MANLPIRDCSAIQRQRFHAPTVGRVAFDCEMQGRRTNFQRGRLHQRRADLILARCRIKRIEPECGKNIPRAHLPAVLVSVKALAVRRVTLHQDLPHPTLRLFRRTEAIVEIRAVMARLIAVDRPVAASVGLEKDRVGEFIKPYRSLDRPTSETPPRSRKGTRTSHPQPTGTSPRQSISPYQFIPTTRTWSRSSRAFEGQRRISFIPDGMGFQVTNHCDEPASVA